MFDPDKVGDTWLRKKVNAMVSRIDYMTPVEVSEQYRYLPSGITSRAGMMRFDKFQYAKEILNNQDIRSDVRETNVMKGVQVAMTTTGESGILYNIKVGGIPMMFVTADYGLANIRMENNIFPMIHNAGFSDLIRSSDVGNSRKTGKNKYLVQFSNGCVLVPIGANNMDRMRQDSFQYMHKDELDGWKRQVGNEGTTDATTDGRLAAYWGTRKIYRISTPTQYPSMINEAYERGDKRKYMVCCKQCSYPQEIRREHINKETGLVGGFKWDLDEHGLLINETVRYCCANCGQEHYEHDKTNLFSEANGAHWKPTSIPKESGIRSYYLPAFYSPSGFTPWYKCISDYLSAFNHEDNTVKDYARMQDYYNLVLGIPFKLPGTKVSFSSVSSHRRSGYSLGQVPNKYAAKYSGSKILFLTCQVDVHDRNLAVCVMGWTSLGRCYVIDYWRFECKKDDLNCDEITNPVWQRLRDLIREAIYVADDGQSYKICKTFIDSRHFTPTVYSFCSEEGVSVSPIQGVSFVSRNSVTKQFSEYRTKSNDIGYKIVVDYYKDSISGILRRDWYEIQGLQPEKHFNAPVDISQKQLKELTAERRVEQKDNRGMVTYAWKRSGGVDNELFDLYVYGSACVDIIAYGICIINFELDAINWGDFWKFVELDESGELFSRF